MRLSCARWGCRRLGWLHQLCGKRRLQVFSLSGQSLRKISGEWWEARCLTAMNDRLYLTEFGGDDADSDASEEGDEHPDYGKRIFVLTRDGTPLQIFRIDNLPHIEMDHIWHMVGVPRGGQDAPSCLMASITYMYEFEDGFEECDALMELRGV